VSRNPELEPGHQGRHKLLLDFRCVVAAAWEGEIRGKVRHGKGWEPLNRQPAESTSMIGQHIAHHSMAHSHAHAPWASLCAALEEIEDSSADGGEQELVDANLGSYGRY
jgi:hypothetical protein